MVLRIVWGYTTKNLSADANHGKWNCACQKWALGRDFSRKILNGGSGVAYPVREVPEFPHGAKIHFLRYELLNFRCGLVPHFTMLINCDKGCSIFSAKNYPFFRTRRNWSKLVKKKILWIALNFQMRYWTIWNRTSTFHKLPKLSENASGKYIVS